MYVYVSMNRTLMASFTAGPAKAEQQQQQKTQQEEERAETWVNDGVLKAHSGKAVSPLGGYCEAEGPR